MAQSQCFELCFEEFDELVDNVVLQGDGHQVKFAPAKEKVSPGACLGFQTF